MSAYAFTALFNAAVSFIFGLWVLGMNPGRSSNRRWFALTASIALMSFSQFMRETADTPAGATFWGLYVAYLGGTLIPVTFFHFIIDYVRLKSAHGKTLVAGLYAAAVLIVGSIFLSDQVIRGMSPNPFFRYYIDPGRYYAVFLAYFGLTVVLGVVALVWGIRRSTGLKREQLRILLAASLIGFLGGTTVLLPVLKVNVFPFGNYFLSLYIFLVSYGVFKHRLMDIDIFLRKSLSAFIVVLTFVIPLVILLVLLQDYFFLRVNPIFTILVSTAVLLAVLTFPFFRSRMEKTLDLILFPQRFEDRATIAKLAGEAVSILDLPKLLSSLTETLARNFGAARAAVMVLDEKREQVRVQEAKGPVPAEDWPSLSLDSPWIGWLQEHPGTLYGEALPPREAGMPEGDLTSLLGVPLVLPLVVKSRLAGLILMGERDGGRPYSADDLDLLRTLANQAAIAIENARLYEDLKRSRQYMRRADRLASLGTLAAGLAHEIRNPLVSIKTFIQLLPQRLDDPDFRTNFLSIANDEVERIRRLVEELLSFARPSEPDLQPVDLNEVVEKTLLLVDNDIRHKGISLESALETGLPEVLMDKEQVKQVILNVALNAIQAVDSGGRIAVTTRTVGLSGERPMVQVEVRDDGPGIAEEDLEHIFNPFFTTKQMGSGLGLAISHQIIKEHQGSLEVDSVRGSGTSFFVNLPLDPRRHDRRRNRDGQDPGG